VRNGTEEMWKEEGWAVLTVIFLHLRQVLLPLYAFVADREALTFTAQVATLGLTVPAAEI